MKIERYNPEPVAQKPHPLADAVDPIKGLGIGEAIRISRLPLEYMATSCERLQKALEGLLPEIRLRVEVGDHAMTPESYIVTRVG